jgi:predicted DsbA family dithiol-disulfide isomerase
MPEMVRVEKRAVQSVPWRGLVGRNFLRSPRGPLGMVQPVSVIEVYADIWCPFAHVGLRSVLRRRNQMGRDDVVLRVRAWPLELVNGAPLDPKTTGEHVDDLRTQVATDLFSHFDPSHFPLTTLPALALVAAAYRRDDASGEAVSLALRDALFEEGRDISHSDVLAAVASEHGVGDPGIEDDRAVRDEWHEGESRGVKGSPHFFCGGAEAFCPTLDISKDAEGHVHVRRDMEALDAFLAECFK